MNSLLLGTILVPALLLAGMFLGERLDRPPARLYADAQPAMPSSASSTSGQAARRVMSVQTVAARSTALPENSPVRVSWVDGDSGTINGVPFRLYGVDAPEGSPMRAGCDREMRRAAAASRAAREATDGKVVTLLHAYGEDRYGRQLVDLKADGRDVASLLIGQGHLKYWRYSSGQEKPDWCG